MNSKLFSILHSVSRLCTFENAGSGVFISPNQILTTHHNITQALTLNADLEKIKEIRHSIFCDVFSENGFKKHLANIIAYDSSKDLALLQLKNSTVEHYTPLIAKTEIKNCNVFDELYIIGAGAEHDPLPTKGILTYKKEKVGYEFYWMTDANITHGDSGGGVFKKLKNNYFLIGIITSMGIDENSNQIVHMTDFVPPNLMYDFLEKINYE